MTETAAHHLVWAGAWPEQSSVTDHRNFKLDCVLHRKPVESNQNWCHMRRSCTLGPLVNELSRYFTPKKIRLEKNWRQFFASELLHRQAFECRTLVPMEFVVYLFLHEPVRPREVGFRSEDDGRATFCLRMLFHCLQQSSAPLLRSKQPVFFWSSPSEVGWGTSSHR